MLKYVRSKGLRITRPSRVVLASRQKSVRNYQPDDLLMVEIGANINLKEQNWIESALAFSPLSLEIHQDAEGESAPARTLKQHLEALLAKRPNAYLFIGKVPGAEEEAALKLLQIPYRIVQAPQAPQDATEFPQDNQERHIWRDAFDRRNVLYAHFERAEPIEKVLDAVRLARRNYPELLLVISGLCMQDIPYQGYGFVVMNETTKKIHLQYADIMVLKSRVYQPLMSSLATVQIVTQMRNLRQLATHALENSTSVVLYDVRPQSLGPLAELTNSGTIWNVRRKESLGAALSQALSLEDSANVTLQSLKRLTETDNELIQAIDELAGLERAA